MTPRFLAEWLGEGMPFAKPPLPHPRQGGRAGTGSVRLSLGWACCTHGFLGKTQKVARQKSPSVESELRAEWRRGDLEHFSPLASGEG